MYNEKEILARLQNGEDAELIIKEIVDKFNATNQKFKKEQEEAAEKAKLAAKKKEDLRAVVAAFINWMSSYYATTPEEVEVFKGAIDKFDIDDLIATIDSLYKYKDAFSKIKITTKKNGDTQKTKIKVGSPEDIFDEFFKIMGW